MPPKTVGKGKGGDVDENDVSPNRFSQKVLLAGAILASALMTGLAVGLSNRNNSSSGNNGDADSVNAQGVASQNADKNSIPTSGPPFRPTLKPTHAPTYQVPAKTGFEFIDAYDGPENKLETHAKATGVEHIDDFPGPDEYQLADDTEEVESVDLADTLEWVDILDADKDDDDRSKDVVDEDKALTVVPTKFPTTTPTEGTTASPLSPVPTPLPTRMPSTDAPTSYLWYTLSEPDDPDETYFNYSPTSMSDYGPDSWASLSDTKEKEYWSEYDEWIDPDLSRNYCNSGSNRQSPIDLSFEVVNGECFEYHQIKDRAGTANMYDEKHVRFEIHPSKLRINYAWESTPMRNVDPEEEFVGPSADIPKGEYFVHGAIGCMLLYQMKL